MALAIRDGGVLIAIFTSAVALAGSVFTYFNNSRNQDIEMVRIALSILSGENKDTSIYGRRYALKVLEEYAVEIDDSDFELWAKTGTIPDIGWLPAPNSLLSAFGELPTADKFSDFTEYVWTKNADGTFSYRKKQSAIQDQKEKQ